MTTSDANAGANPHTRGILCMLLAVASFACMDASMKALAAHYPPMQVTALRGLTSLPLALIWAALDGGFGQLLRVRWSLHFARGVLSVLMLVAFVFALRTTPLTEAYALFFVAPLLITALAVPILGERVGPLRWAAIVVGLCGTLIVLRPSTRGMLSLGGLAVLVAATGYALSAIIVRVLGRTDSTQSMVVWMLAMLSAFALALAWREWIPLGASHWKPLAVLAVSGAVGQYGITEAFRRAPASVVAPLDYTALIWGLLLDAALWHTWPDRWMLAGAAVIVVCGLYLIRREPEPLEAEPP